jgi:hypothetical protein
VVGREAHHEHYSKRPDVSFRQRSRFFEPCRVVAPIPTRSPSSLISRFRAKTFRRGKGKTESPVQRPGFSVFVVRLPRTAARLTIASEPSNSRLVFSKAQARRSKPIRSGLCSFDSEFHLRADPDYKPRFDLAEDDLMGNFEIRV